MKCAATRKQFIKQKRFDEGRRDAEEKYLLLLTDCLSGKNRYKNSRVYQIVSSFNRLMEDISRGIRTEQELMAVLKEKYALQVESNKTERPEALFYADYVRGVYSYTDTANTVLLYVLIHLYGMGQEKVQKLMNDINSGAAAINQGYVTQQDIKDSLLEEEGLEVKHR